MKDNVPASFDQSTVVVGSGYPNDIPSRIFGIAKEATRLAMWVELG